jgi:hypothetical protein
MLQQVNALAPILKLVLVAAIGLFVLDVLLLAGVLLSSTYKIDPGVGTLTGAVIGLSVVAWQARTGFDNLIKSQENQARIERDAREHSAELDRVSEERKTQNDRAVLLAALRAEIAYLFGQVTDAERHIRGLLFLEQALIRQQSPSTTKIIALHSFDAPISKANVPHLGMLGANLGADIIKVLSRANDKEIKFSVEQPMPHDVVLMIFQGNLTSLRKWSSDLYHAAMRIRAYEDNTKDPGTLTETEAERYKDVKEET